MELTIVEGEWWELDFFEYGDENQQNKVVCVGRKKWRRTNEDGYIKGEVWDYEKFLENQPELDTFDAINFFL